MLNGKHVTIRIDTILGVEESDNGSRIYVYWRDEPIDVADKSCDIDMKLRLGLN